MQKYKKKNLQTRMLPTILSALSFFNLCLPFNANVSVIPNFYFLIYSYPSVLMLSTGLLVATFSVRLMMDRKAMARVKRAAAISTHQGIGI